MLVTLPPPPPKTMYLHGLALVSWFSINYKAAIAIVVEMRFSLFGLANLQGNPFHRKLKQRVMDQRFRSQFENK